MIQQHLRDAIDWEQPFTPQEYAGRRQRVRQALAAAGLDAIYVTNPADLTWLTGYDMIWYHLENLTGLLVTAASDETLFFDGTAHTTIVSTTPEIGAVCWLQAGAVEAQCRQIAARLAACLPARPRLALQPWAYAPHGRVHATLAAAVEATGAATDDGSFLVEELRLVKSPAEIAVVRRAAEIADTAMAAARDAIADGVMETEIEGVLMAAMMKAGGGYPGIRTMVASGPRSGTHHSPAQHRRIRQGELVFIDFCGCLHRYHVNLNRTFSLGAPDRRWSELMTASAGCADAVMAEIRPGDPFSKVQQVADAHIDRAGLRPLVWFVGGYTLGIAVPPDWCGSHWFEPRFNLGERTVTPGQVFNLENQFDVWEGWPGGSGAAWIESFLVTENGLEVLSALPRHLVTV